MKTTMHPDMTEATRLTREGRLIEATAVLQRMLQSGMEPDTKTKGGYTAAGSRPRGAADIVEVTSEMSKVRSRRRTSPTGQVEADSEDGLSANLDASLRSPMSDRLRGFIEKVRRFGTRQSGAARSAAPASSDAPGVRTRPGRFLTAAFTGQAGTRAYKLYIPSTYRGRPLPLVVMLHGCTQSVEDFAAGTQMNIVAEERSFFVAYPAQPNSANGSKCWNWFNPGDQQRDRGEPSLIAGITLEISRNYAIDPKRIYVAGLSAGGAAAAIVGASYPDIFAAIGVHSGLPCGAASDLTSAFSVMQQGNPKTSSRLPQSSTFHGHGRLVPTIVFHGDKDTTVHPRNGHHVIEQSRSNSLGELRSVTQLGHVPGGRSYSRTSHFDASGRGVLEMWVVHGAGHAWSGGSPRGSYTDAHGPDASREMVRFFLEHSHPSKQSYSELQKGSKPSA
jgi:poly(hydroxyalkanoate) depolymerase family esterase